MSLPVFPESVPAPNRRIMNEDDYDLVAQTWANWIVTIPGLLNQWTLDVADALGGVDFVATSTDELEFTLGVKPLTIDSGKRFVPGTPITIADASAPATKWLDGRVTSYNFETGALGFDCQLVAPGAVGSASAWIVSLSGPPGVLRPGSYGAFTISADGTLATPNDNTIGNAKLADMVTARIKGRTSAGAGDPEDLTGTQVTALLDAFAGTLKGLVPTGSGNSPAVYLRGDGAWGSPSADASAWTQIGSTVNASGGSSVTFTSIPQIYSELMVECDLLSINSGGGNPTITAGISTDGVTWSPTFEGGFIGSSDVSATYSARLWFPRYTSNRGMFRSAFAAETASTPTIRGLGEEMLATIWRCIGGIKALRIGLLNGSSPTFDAGTVSLFGR